MIMFTFIPSAAVQNNWWIISYISIRAYKISIILCKLNLFMESSLKAIYNTNRQTETALLQKLNLKLTRCFTCNKASLDLDGVKFKRKRKTCNIWKSV